MAAGLLALDGTENAKKIDQHHRVSKFGPIVKAVDLTTTLWDASKWKDVIEIHTKVGVYVVDEGLDILLGCLVERNNCESRSTTANGLEDRLVIFDRLPAVARGSNDLGTAGEETLNNFNTNRAFADASKECVLVLESSA